MNNDWNDLMTESTPLNTSPYAPPRLLYFVLKDLASSSALRGSMLGSRRIISDASSISAPLPLLELCSFSFDSFRGTGFDWS